MFFGMCLHSWFVASRPALRCLRFDSEPAGMLYFLPPFSCLSRLALAAAHGSLMMLITQVSRGYGRHVKIEWKSQVDKATHSGARITNLSSHEHLHMIPGIFGVLTSLAKEYGIRYIRVLRKEIMVYPFSINKVFRSAVVDYFHPGMEILLKKSGMIRVSQSLL